MKALVVGATGATGRLLAEQILGLGLEVSVIVRSAERLPDQVKNHARCSITEAGLLSLSDSELADHVKDCGAIASCLGHNVTLKGMYGKPRRLVTDATARLCAAVKSNQPDRAVRFVLMNTSANRNPDLDERRSIGERMAIGLLRALLPPQADNEKAAEHLRVAVGKDDPTIEWVAVRPDGLVDDDRVTDYEPHPSPIRSPIFDSGKTSRINVANFMARLMTDDDLFGEWKGQMPVIYNKSLQ